MDFNLLRREMVKDQLISRGISDENVLSAFLSVPREEFVPPEYKEHAYDDAALPIEHRQTISQPFVVAIMTELLRIGPESKVLEIGTGSGYQTAILSKLCCKVITIDRIADLGQKAKEIFKKLGYDNIEAVVGDGTAGYETEAPYDRIIVTAAAPQIPPPLLEQLKTDGKMAIPVSSGFGQILKLVTKTQGRIEIEDSIPCFFVPLLGKYGY